MKAKQKIISAVLALSMAAGIIPAVPAFAEEEAQLLKTERADMSDLPAGGGYFTMGNMQTNIPEKDGRYILTVYRDGDVSTEASVKVKTVDVSAVYGKDYVMDDDRYETVTQETEGTIIERFGKDEYLDATNKDIEEINENSEMLEEAYEAQQLAGSDEADSEPAENAEATETEPQEKSPLAQIKEAQTGLETRETYESEDAILNPTQIAGGFDIANQMETSSYTTVYFGAGETEKQVIFKILDDGESEGQEMINFILSEPVSAAVTEPFTTTIVIDDNEPVEHSKVSFTSDTYNAENGTATITFKREGALYQYVTSEVKSKNGTAVSGTNFKAVNGTVEFLPYRDEATIEIPVAPSAETTSFTLELSDLKGGDDGDIMSAEVFITGSGGGTNTFELMADPKITINNETFRVDKSQNDTFARIYRENRPNDTVGYWVSPKVFDYRGAHGKNTPSYSTCSYDAGKGAGVLKWYSRLCWETGNVIADYNFNNKLYQSAWCDFSTHTGGGSSTNHGFRVLFGDSEARGTVESYFVSGTNAQKWYGPVRKLWKAGYMDGATQRYDLKPTGEDKALVRMYAERVSSGLYEPTMHVYGIVLFNKQFRVATVNPDPITLKTANGGTRQVIPGKVSVAGNKETVYREGTLVFNADPISGEKQKWGELIGYDITIGTGPNARKISLCPRSKKNELGLAWVDVGANTLSDDCLTLNFTNELVDILDKFTYGSVTETGLGYETYLEFKPVYRKIPVKVNVIPADKNMGTFDSQYLKNSSTNQLFFGDEISLKASSPQENVRSDAYAFKAYETAGSTLAAITSDSTSYEENPTIQLSYRKYDFKPLFTDLPNHIQINADREVLKYFDISNSVQGSTTNVDGLKGMTLLKTGRDGTFTPIAGKAYKIELVPKKGVTLPEGVRPRITSEYDTSTYVDGYVMDFIAQAQYQQNRYKISMEKYSGDYQYFDLKGVAQYTSIAMMDNTKPLTNEPAKMNQVFAGGWLQTAKDADSGDDITIPQRQGEVTDHNGKIDIAGVKAVPGDVISILVTNNNIDQVQYLKLSDAGAKENKQFSEITGYKETENRFGDTVWESVVTQVTKPCIVVDMNRFEMPVKTAYAPYVRNVSLEYDTETIAGNTTSVPLPDQRPLLTMKARVETNETDVKFVEFIVYKSSGEPKGKIAAVTENSNGKISEAPQYTYRTDKPDASGYCSAEMESKELDDGDQLFVRIVSNTKNDAGEFITYPIMNVGVIFYTPISEDDGTYVEVDLKSMGEIPYVKTLSGKMGSGKLYFDTEYADPKNKRKSAYTKSVGISADLLHIKSSSDNKKNDEKKEKNSSSWFNKDAFEKATNGQHNKPKKSNEDTIKEQKAKMDPTGEANKMKKNLLGAYDDEIAKRFPNRTPSAKEKEAVAKEMYEKDAYKNSEGKVGTEHTVDMSAKVVLQFTYVYDEATKQHVFGGGEYLIAATVSAEKIWTWVVNGVPLYIQVKGDISAQVDGTWINPDKVGGTTLTAKEMKPIKNMLNNRFSHKNEMPWIQLGLNVKLTAGVGKCGVLDAHGSLKLGLIFRFTFVGGELTTKVDENDKGGTMVDFAGSIGVTLLIITIDIQLARIKQGWGKFDTGGVVVEGPSIDVQSVDEDEQERAEKGYTTNIRATGVGDEHDGGDEWQLSSILKQVGEAKNVKEDTMERIDPQAVQLKNGETFVVYTYGDKTQDVANAATLNYMIRNSEGVYSESKPVQGDGIADASPALLYDPSKGEDGTVYVAWTSADTKIDNLTGDKANDIQTTKDNLNKLNIYLRSYDVHSKEWSNVTKLTDDGFVNSEAKLSIENGKIAVYYFKLNLTNVEKVEDILSMTQNYNTWAKQLIDPETMQPVAIGKYAKDDNFGHHAGDNITEQLLYVQHPNAYDPLITDFSTETFTYKYKDDEPIEYSLATYTIDRDGKLETTKDHEVWLQIVNVTNDKAYYPVLLGSADSGLEESDVSMPRLTKRGDDVLITWVKDGTKFNLINVKDTLDSIRTDFRPVNAENKTEAELENEIPTYENSALKVFVDTDHTQRFWYRTAGEEAAKIGSTEGISVNIAADSFPIITKDFGSNGRTDALRKDSLIGDYHLVTGNDGNIYLFWSASSDDPDEAASSLYASSYYRVSSKSQENYGTGVSYGFSDAVEISNPGLMIDELTAVVDGDSSALLLANTYERKWVEKGSQTDPFEDGKHNLTEFAFKPFNSLEIVDDEIAMYNVEDIDTDAVYTTADTNEGEGKAETVPATNENDAETDYTTVMEDYPKAGEKIMFKWSIKNNGLLPSVGHNAKLEVLDGSNVIYKFEETKKGDGEQIYVGDTLMYGTSETKDGNTVPVTWEVPENLNLDNVTVRLTVNELDKYGNNLNDPVVIERKIDKQSSLQYQEPYAPSYSDIRDVINDKVFENEKLKGIDFDIFDFLFDLEYISDYLKALKEVISELYPEFKPLLSNINENNAPEYIDKYDYIVYVPVRNIGNSNAKVTAKFKYVNSEGELTEEILGTTPDEVNVEPTTTDGDEYTNIIIPIDVNKEHFDNYGVIKGLVDIYEDGEKVIENIGTYIFEEGNVDFTLAKENETINLDKGQTYTIETEAFPFDGGKQMAYWSDNTDVVTVSEDGVVTAAGEGDAVVYVIETNVERSHMIAFHVTDTGAAPTPKPSSGGGGGGGGSSAKVNVYNSGSGSKGKISVSKNNPAKGDTVEVTVTPDNGYEVDKLIVTDSKGNEIEVTKNDDGTFSFVQPDGKVTVKAEYKKIDGTDSGNNGNTGNTGNEGGKDWWFKDVPENAWFYAPIKDAYDAERMAGMSEDYFEPETDITRGMFASAIYRREGSPETDAVNKFDDVKEGSYYEKAIAWATENGIVVGYDDATYGPDDPITREQLASILWRYAQFKAYDVSIGEDTNILDYTDSADISEYAVPAVCWAVGDSVLSGFEDSTMRPQSNANRAQMAVILNKISDLF